MQETVVVLFSLLPRLTLPMKRWRAWSRGGHRAASWGCRIIIPSAMSPNPCRLNGSLPKGVEAQNRTLFFRGPINYSLAGTYICKATNPIGTRSGQVEVNITGRKRHPSPPLLTHCLLRCRCPHLLVLSLQEAFVSSSCFSCSPLSSGHWSSFDFLFPV